jgi:hypothetical protein
MARPTAQPWIGTSRQDVIHTAGLSGALPFDGKAMTDTLVFDTTDGSPFGGSSTDRLDVNIGARVGFIMGGPLDGSTIQSIENFTFNNFTTVQLLFQGNDGANVVTVNGPGTATGT